MREFSFKDEWPEAKALYLELAPIFSGHRIFACMTALAYLFAHWLDQHKSENHAELIKLFHRTAMGAYDDLQQARKELRQ